MKNNRKKVWKASPAKSYEESELLNSSNDPVKYTTKLAVNYELPQKPEELSPRVPMLMKTMSEMANTPKKKPEDMLELVRENQLISARRQSHAKTDELAVEKLKFKQRDNVKPPTIQIESKQMYMGLHEPEKMLQHAETINAIMIDIMPGLLQMCCQRYTAQMIKIYFRQVRKEQLLLLQ